VVLDELGFIPFSKEGGQVLFELCSDLNERVSIIITTNLRFADWNGIFGDEIMTTSLLDRLTSKGHILASFGESYRFRQRMQLEEQAASEQAR
jgi:DNA replication protein DnaC